MRSLDPGGGGGGGDDDSGSSSDAADELTRRDQGSTESDGGGGGGGIDAGEVTDIVNEDTGGGGSSGGGGGGSTGGDDRSTDPGFTSGGGDTTTSPADPGGSDNTSGSTGGGSSTDPADELSNRDPGSRPSDDTDSESGAGGGGSSSDPADELTNRDPGGGPSGPPGSRDRRPSDDGLPTSGTGDPADPSGRTDPADSTESTDPGGTTRPDRRDDPTRNQSPDVRFQRGSDAEQDAVTAAVATDVESVDMQGVEGGTSETAQQAREFEDRLVRNGVEVQTEDGTRRIQIQDSSEIAIEQRNGELVPVFTDAFRSRRRREAARRLGRRQANQSAVVDEEDVTVTVGDETTETTVDSDAVEQARLRAARRQFEAERQGSRLPSDGGLTAGDDAQQVTTDRLQRFEADDFEFDITDDEITVGLSEAAARTDLREQVAARNDDVDPGDVVVEETEDGISARMSDEVIQEQFASGMTGVDADDIVLDRDGDDVSLDREATARRVTGADDESEPGAVAEAAGFVTESIRDSSAGLDTALTVGAMSLRTDPGVTLDFDGVRVPIPGGDDVDAARDELEPAADRLDAGADDVGGGIESTLDFLDTNGQTVAPSLGEQALMTFASSDFGSGAIGRGVTGGLEALNPARGAQDALTLGEYGIRGAEAASDDDAAETLQTAGEATATIGELAVTEGAPAAAQAAREDPQGAVAVSIGGGLVLASGVATGTAASRGAGTALRGLSDAPGAARRVGSESLSMARRSGRRIARSERRPRVSVERDPDAGLIEINGDAPTEVAERGLARMLVRAQNTRQDVSRAAGVRATGYAADADLATQRGLVGAQNLRQDAQQAVENLSFDEFAGRGVVRARNIRQDVRRGVGLQAGRVAADADLAVQRGLVGAQNLRYDASSALDDISFDEFVGRGVVRARNVRQDARRAAAVRATGYAADIDLALGRAGAQYQNLRFGSGDGLGLSTDLGEAASRGLVRAQNARQDVRRAAGVRAARYAAEADLAAQRGLVGAQNLRYDTRWALEDLSFDEFAGRGVARAQNARQDARMAVGRRLTGASADLDLATRRALVGVQNLRYDTRWALESAPDALEGVASRGLVSARNLRTDSGRLGDLTLRINTGSRDGRRVIDVEDLQGPSEAEVPVYRSRDAEGYEPGTDIPESGSVGENTLTQESLTDVGGGQVARIRSRVRRESDALDSMQRVDQLEDATGAVGTRRFLGGAATGYAAGRGLERAMATSVAGTDAQLGADTATGRSLDPFQRSDAIGEIAGAGVGVGIGEMVGLSEGLREDQILRQDQDITRRYDTPNRLITPRPRIPGPRPRVPGIDLPDTDADGPSGNPFLDETSDTYESGIGDLDDILSGDDENDEPFDLFGR